MTNTTGAFAAMRVVVIIGIGVLMFASAVIGCYIAIHERAGVPD